MNGTNTIDIEEAIRIQKMLEAEMAALNALYSIIPENGGWVAVEKEFLTLPPLQDVINEAYRQQKGGEE